jgi:hypothetical protein
LQLARAGVTHFNRSKDEVRESAHKFTACLPLTIRRIGKTAAAPAAIKDEAGLNDELKKLGLRVRQRKVGTTDREKPGEIAFDDRGNAIYAWTDDRLVEDGEDGERARERALAHPGLSLVDDEPSANAPIRSNPKGLRQGYDPYESGVLAKKQLHKKRDLRELSKWLEMKRKLDSDEIE